MDGDTPRRSALNATKGSQMFKRTLPVLITALLVTGADAAGPLDWSGFYVGAQVGGSVFNGTLKSLDYCMGSGICVSEFSAAQVLAGGVVGYAFQLDDMVLGVEGDVNAKFGSADSMLQGFDSYQGDWRTDSPWDASLRARVGLLATPQFLAFVTGGVSAASFTIANPNCPGCAEWGTGNLHGDTRFGWGVGVGGEYALDDNLHLRAQYLHADYGSHNAIGSGAGYEYSSQISTDTVTAGVTFSLD